MSEKKGTLHLVDPDAPVEESDDREYFEPQHLAKR
jgi:hypothetical protein